MDKKKKHHKKGKIVFEKHKLAQGLSENNPGKYLNFALSILHVSVIIKRNCTDI